MQVTFPTGNVGNTCFDSVKVAVFGITVIQEYRVFLDFRTNYAKELLSMSDGSRSEYRNSYDAFYDGRRWRSSNPRARMEMGKTG